MLADALRKLPPKGSRHCLVAFTLRNTLSDHGPVSRGVCHAGKDGLLQTVVEHHKVEQKGATVHGLRDSKPVTLTGEEPVSMNLWGFAPTIFEHLDREFRKFLPTAMDNAGAEFQLPTVVDTLIRGGRAEVEVIRSGERWLGVTYPEDKARVVSGIRDLVRAWAMVRGSETTDRPFEEYLGPIKDMLSEEAEFRVYWPLKVPGAVPAEPVQIAPAPVAEGATEEPAAPPAAEAEASAA